MLLEDKEEMDPDSDQTITDDGGSSTDEEELRSVLTFFNGSRVVSPGHHVRDRGAVSATTNYGLNLSENQLFRTILSDFSETVDGSPIEVPAWTIKNNMLFLHQTETRTFRTVQHALSAFQEVTTVNDDRSRVVSGTDAATAYRATKRHKVDAKLLDEFRTLVLRRKFQDHAMASMLLYTYPSMLVHYVPRRKIAVVQDVLLESVRMEIFRQYMERLPRWVRTHPWIDTTVASIEFYPIAEPTQVDISAEKLAAVIRVPGLLVDFDRTQQRMFAKHE
jgi:hypothetical protein